MASITARAVALIAPHQHRPRMMTSGLVSDRPRVSSGIPAYLLSPALIACACRSASVCRRPFQYMWIIQAASPQLAAASSPIPMRTASVAPVVLRPRAVKRTHLTRKPNRHERILDDVGANHVPVMRRARSTRGRIADEHIFLWDVRTGEQIFSLNEGTPNEPMCSVAFSPDGQTLASGGGNQLHLRDARTGKRHRALAGLTGRPEDSYKGSLTFVESVAFSPDGQLLASASIGEVCLWTTHP